MPSHDEQLITRIRGLVFEWQLSDLSTFEVMQLARMVRDGDLLHINEITPAPEDAE